MKRLLLLLFLLAGLECKAQLSLTLVGNYLATTQVWTGTNTFSIWLAGNGGGLTNLSASAISDAVRVIYRSSTPVTNVNSSAETVMATIPIAANALGTNKSVVVEINGNYLNNSGVATNIVWSFVYGGTTNVMTPVTTSTTANRRAFWIRLTLRNIDATNAQVLNGEAMINAAGTTTIGNGSVLTSNGGTSFLGGFYGTSSEDFTALKNFYFVTQWAGAATTISFVVNSITATLY